MSTLHSLANPVMMATEIIEDEDAGAEVLQQLSHFEHAAEMMALVHELVLHEAGQNLNKTYTRIQQIVRIFCLFFSPNYVTKANFQHVIMDVIA